MWVLVRVEKKCELLVVLLNGVGVGKGLHLEDLVPVGIGGFGGCTEDLEGGDHGGNAVQVWAQPLRSFCVFEG